MDYGSEGKPEKLISDFRGPRPSASKPKGGEEESPRLGQGVTSGSNVEHALSTESIAVPNNAPLSIISEERG